MVILRTELSRTTTNPVLNRVAVIALALAVGLMLYQMGTHFKFLPIFGPNAWLQSGGLIILASIISFVSITASIILDRIRHGDDREEPDWMISVMFLSGVMFPLSILWIAARAFVG
jgi:hypothetical protein